MEILQYFTRETSSKKTFNGRQIVREGREA